MKIISLQNPWWRRLGLLLAAACAGGIMAMMAAYLYLAPLLPSAEQLRSVDYQIPLRVFSRDGRLLGEFGEKRRTPLDYEQFPPALVQAVVSAEDERFFRHGGVDLKGLFRAALELLWYQDIRSGGSTITMQVARNFFLDREQKFIRKFNEIVLAMEIERQLSKEQIMALYLNKIYLGHRSYGAEAAAQVYYGKSLAQLDLAQLAMIAGLPKAPSAYNPITNPQRALTRRNWILGRMRSLGSITEEAYQEALAQPVSASYHGPSPDVDASYLAEMVRQDLLGRFSEEQVYSSGMRVYTTLDSERQRAALRALRDGLHEYDERHGWRGAVSTLVLPADVTGTEEEKSSEGDQPVAPVDGTDTDEDPWKPIRDALRNIGTVGYLEPAVVVGLEEQQATLMLADGSQVVLPWEQMSWARRFIDIERVGEEPATASEIVELGEVVYLRPVAEDEAGNRWRLAQVPQVESALVSLDPQDGAVQALVGGYSFSQSHFNRAWQGQRQAGSAFKPFIYTAGLLNGLTPATLINDAPIVFEDSALETAWRPTGASNRFYGPTRLREALYRSLNLVSVRMLQQITVPNAIATLRQFGLPVERFPRDLSLALGSASVTPMELATAYCVFANGGYRVEPWFIERIEDNNGEVVWRAPAVLLCDDEDCSNLSAGAATDEVEVTAIDDNNDVRAESSNDTTDDAIAPPPVKRLRVLDERTAWLMDSMLKDVVRRGTAYRAAQLGRRDLAGKTGTTNDQFDAWFSGYSPALVATVWVGFDNPSTLGRGEYGGRAALPIWMQYMGDALDGVEQTLLPQPAGIVSARINAETGKQAQPGDASAVFEYFREENLPEMDTSPASQSTGGETPDHLF